MEQLVFKTEVFEGPLELLLALIAKNKMDILDIKISLIFDQYMEYLEKIFKRTGWTSLLTSLVFAILGILLITNPEGSTKVVSLIVGILFIIVGLYKLVDYCLTRGKYNFYNYDIAYGIIAIILGIITIVYKSQIETIFRVLIGIWIVYTGIIRLSLSFKLKLVESPTWICSLLISIVMIVCGLYTIFVSNAIVVTIGIVILIYSILDMIEDIIFLSNIKKLEK